MKPFLSIKGLSKSAWLWTWKGKTSRKSLVLAVGCITLFQLVLVHFESWRILVQPKDSNIVFPLISAPGAY